MCIAMPSAACSIKFNQGPIAASESHSTQSRGIINHSSRKCCHESASRECDGQNQTLNQAPIIPCSLSRTASAACAIICNDLVA